MHTRDDFKRELTSIFQAAVEAADPARAVRENLSLDGDRLTVVGDEYDLSRFNRIVLLGAGKGAAPMAAAVEEVLGERLEGGVVVVKYGHDLPLKRVRVLEAAHPEPDEAGVEAGREVLALAESFDAQTLCIAVLTGGASALLVAPAEGTDLVEKQAVTRMLLASGAAIEEINTVRKHLSAIKGGRLAQVCAPATVAGLVVSDVIGDDLSVIASGPFSPDETTYANSLDVLLKYDIGDYVPGVRKYFEEADVQDDTPGADDSAFDNVRMTVVAGNQASLKAATRQAADLGYAPLPLTSCLHGEAREAAGFLTAIAQSSVEEGVPVRPPLCILAGGETTVTLHGKGKGGRNQELALAAAIELAGYESVALLSAGTDGTDGPTDAAGAFAFGDTLGRAEEHGLNPDESLADNDSYTFFHALDDLLMTGPTRTNVMDVVVLLVR